MEDFALHGSSLCSKGSPIGQGRGGGADQHVDPELLVGDARRGQVLHVAFDEVTQRAHVMLHHRPQQQPRLKGHVLQSGAAVCKPCFKNITSGIQLVMGPRYKPNISASGIMVGSTYYVMRPRHG